MIFEMKIYFSFSWIADNEVPDFDEQTIKIRIFLKLQALARPKIPRQIDGFWPGDNKYCPGVIAIFDEYSGKHAVHCFDDDKEILKLSDGKWRILSSIQVPVRQLEKRIPRIYWYIPLNIWLQTLLLHETQRLPSFLVPNAYLKQETSFLKQAKQIPVQEIPRNANMISSLWKETNARIAPHGKKELENSNVETESAPY